MCEPMIESEYSQISPERAGSFFCLRSPMTQVNKTRQLRRDLKIVEPSYTSAACELKSGIAGERRLWSINYGGW